MLFPMGRRWEEDVAEGAFRELEFESSLDVVKIWCADPGVKGEMDTFLVAGPVMFLLERLRTKCALVMIVYGCSLPCSNAFGFGLFGE
jgi:hypothetical protein